jgi:hypothetical protein
MPQARQSAPPGAGADEFRLDGYVALVTGAGRGIGAESPRLTPGPGRTWSWWPGPRPTSAMLPPP